MSEIQDKRVAVLIDAENIAAKHIDEILDKASLEGRATIKRIYGDFTSDSKSSQARGWNKIVANHALSQVQQIQNTSGKNSSDSALIIDAMDLLYSDKIDVMCIVTNDSDFTRLAMRIADSGLIVIGMGTGKQTSSKSFMSACSKFYYLDEKSVGKKAALAAEAAAERKETKKTKSTAKDSGSAAAAGPANGSSPANGNSPANGSGPAAPVQAGAKATDKVQTVPKKVVDTIITAIENADLIGDDWINIAPIGSVLYRRFPEFDPSLWNRPKQLSMFLKSLDDYFEVEQGEAIGKPTGSYIRIRT